METSKTERVQDLAKLSEGQQKFIDEVRMYIKQQKEKLQSSIAFNEELKSVVQACNEVNEKQAETIEVLMAGLADLETELARRRYIDTSTCLKRLRETRKALDDVVHAESLSSNAESSESSSGKKLAEPATAEDAPVNHDDDDVNHDDACLADERGGERCANESPFSWKKLKKSRNG